MAAGAVLCAGIGMEAAAQQPPPEAVPCFDCHGDAGPAPYAAMPTVHGMPKAVIEGALEEFRQHSRPCTLTPCSDMENCPASDMCEVVTHLDDEAIDSVATWFSAQPWVAANDPFDQSQAAIGAAIHAEKCESCHPGGGARSIGNAPLLRGQRAIYLRKALSDFREGLRAAVVIIDGRVTGWRPQMDELSEADAEALIHFYSSPLQAGE
jgi:cytochrome c553